MIYISIDYIFESEGIEPFEFRNHPNPFNYYGQTKYEEELAVCPKNSCLSNDTSF